MRLIIGIAIVFFNLSGCGEMRVIGNAAIRELRADAIKPNWEKIDREQVEKEENDWERRQFAVAKVKSFSSFRSNPSDRKMPVKGLWEQHGG